MWFLGFLILCITVWEISRGKVGVANIPLLKVERSESPILFWALISGQVLLGALILFRTL